MTEDDHKIVCSELRNMSADIIELSIIAFENIMKLEDQLSDHTSQDSYLLRKAISIAGNARLGISHRMVDLHKKQNSSVQ